MAEKDQEKTKPEPASPVLLEYVIVADEHTDYGIHYVKGDKLNVDAVTGKYLEEQKIARRI